MNTRERMAMQPTNEVIAKMLAERNKGTEDCVTTSFLARQIGMTPMELNECLIDLKILKRNRREKSLKLTQKHENKGLSKYRSKFSYNCQGQIFEIVYPVWTKKGVEFLAKQLGTTLLFK